MKLRGLGFLATLCVPSIASAGGLFLPGAGAISTSRAGAAVASADDGEALALNPAGLAKSKGNTITVSAAMISYAMQFTRRGNYDDVPMEAYPYEGQAFPTVKNDASPPLGFGSVQPVPVIAFVTDLGTAFGGPVPGLHLAIGLYAPNAYPFRDMCTQTSGGCQKYVFNGDFNIPPPTTRYDIIKQEAAVLLPSLGVAYSILPELDVGGRFSLGQATLKSKTGIWGIPGNYEEDIKKDGAFEVDASDNLIPAWGLGVTYRPTPSLEFGANYTSEIDIHGKGTAVSENGPSVNLNGNPITVGPTPDSAAVCAKGGTMEKQKACVDLALPMTAQVGGRYKFLDGNGNLKGDVELDLDWENWGKTCADTDLADGSCTSPSIYRVIVDADIFVNGMDALGLKPSFVNHGLQDTYGLRLGGSYHFGVGPISDMKTGAPDSEIIVRGGVGYDTAAAKTGWLRADIDGASRTTLMIGAAYRTKRFEVDIGGGAILEGTSSNPNVGGGATPCNPDATQMGCTGNNVETPVDQRNEIDPINPLIGPDKQFQSPVNQGDYKSHYVLFNLGFSTWF